MLVKFAAVMAVLFSLNACTSKMPSQFSYDNYSPEVHYEEVNESGAFVDHKIVEDPMRSKYERGAWDKSGQSTASSMSVDPSTRNRINIVFVGDGYTKSEMSRYSSDVSAVIKLLSSAQPFHEYLPYFSFHKVDVVSSDSGVSQEVQGQAKNTALEMSYYCSGIQRLLCINANKAVKEAQNAPAVDSIFALANSSVYGGAGYRSPAISTLAARNPAAVELALHEFGHSFALLGDEYASSGSLQDCPNFPNVSGVSAPEMLNNRTRWYRWLDLPNVGAFEGSCYSNSYYRPTQTSKMRELGKPFDVVNYEQFILSIYKRVRPVDSSTPEGQLKGNQLIQVKPMSPVGHTLKITWLLNDSVIKQFANKRKVDTSKLGLKMGTEYKISAIIVDPTSAVRDEEARASLMTQKLEWTLIP